MSARLSSDSEWRRDLTPMVGKKYGHLTVIAMAGRRDYGASKTTGWRTRYPQVRVRCDCGKEYVTLAHAVRNIIVRCVDCARERNAGLQRARSTRLPSGRTFVEVAERSGVPLNTVTQRWIRGWPEEDLGLPVTVNGRKRSRRPVVRTRVEVQP